MTTPTAGMEPFHGLEINALARRLEAEGRDIAFLEQGQPAAPPAPKVIEAVRAVLDGPQRYTHFAGMPPLREALSRYYAEQHSVTVSPDTIVATMGSSAGFILAFLGAFEPGAKIAVTRPGYTAYLNTLYGMGYQPVEIPVSAAEGWHLTPAMIEAAYAKEKFAGLLLASPANPTGAAVTREQLAAIVATCARLGVRFISDEIYHGLDYRGPSISALEFTRDAIVINSFSKYYCMTGWRIGWMVLPEDVLRRTQILQQNLFIAAPTLSQVAATAALGERDYSEQQKAHYAANRPLLTSGLRALGFGVDEGDGAFYAYADASRFTNDALAFCKRMLDEAGVAASPGVDFDRVNGPRFIRFSYAGSKQTMEKALDRMSTFLKRYEPEIQQKDLVRLDRILALLSSSHAGERASAALAATALIKKHDLTWWQVLEGRALGVKAAAAVRRSDIGIDYLKAAESRIRQLQAHNQMLEKQIRRLKDKLEASEQK